MLATTTNSIFVSENKILKKEFNILRNLISLISFDQA